jgi:hypothetical protein
MVKMIEAMLLNMPRMYLNPSMNPSMQTPQYNNIKTVDSAKQYRNIKIVDSDEESRARSK